LASQQPRELQRFIEILKQRKVKSYLEIGARHGDTFYEVMTSAGIPRGTAVDMPNGPWGGSSEQALRRCCADLSKRHNVTLIIGDSAQVETGYHDAVLIDADHRYEAVKRDWERFNNARIVAFHDIDGEGLDCGGLKIGVPRLWRELKQQYTHEEIIDPSDNRKMGIGVLFLE